MTSQPPGTAARWVIIADYPRRPSPYFSHLHRHVPESMPLTFCPDLDGLRAVVPPGVVNLHRIKRLYHDPVWQARSTRAADTMLRTLSDLRHAGWRLVWTVHNLKPIDGTAAPEADDIATSGVLAIADMVLCHTTADARSLRSRTDAPVHIIGWAGLDEPHQPATDAIAELARDMRSQVPVFLLLGHITPYKDVPATVAAFLANTTRARLVVAGASRDPAISAELKQTVAGADDRVVWYPHRVPPEQAGYLYAAAHAAVCPYRTDGHYDFFADVLYPSSVSTATGYDVPVIAPDLPAIEEITRGRPRWLAAPATGLGAALLAAEAMVTAASPGRDPRTHRPVSDAVHRWQRIGRTYQALTAELLPERVATGRHQTAANHTNNR